MFNVLFLFNFMPSLILQRLSPSFIETLPTDPWRWVWPHIESDSTYCGFLGNQFSLGNKLQWRRRRKKRTALSSCPVTFSVLTIPHGLKSQTMETNEHLLLLFRPPPPSFERREQRIAGKQCPEQHLFYTFFLCRLSIWLWCWHKRRR